jgi:L-2-hydroxyglutarate oxidase LhgO
VTGERIGVVGAGIIGLAVARELTARGARVTVLDKEHRVAAHQTGHNSGVAHAGLYYQPGSLKAVLCRRGIGLLEKFCAEHDLPYQECGKLVIARNEGELDGLAEIQRRATENGVPGLRRLPGLAAIREIEPYATGVAALHSPHTAIVDFPAVCRALAADLQGAGGTLHLGCEVVRLRPRANEVTVTIRVTPPPGSDSRAPLPQVSPAQSDAASSAAGEAPASSHVETLAFDRVVVCAGLQSDRVARLAGDTRGPAIIPFRGEYFRLVPGRTPLVQGLIYPVPDPRYPFLGVHFTRRVDGGVDIGPNAVLATAREGYRRTDLRLADLWETLAWPGFRRMARTHWRTGLKEMYGSVSRRAFIAQARTFVPDLTVADVVAAPAGVRAQAVDADGSLVDDFRIGHVGQITTVRNAPSPGATSSLAIAEYIADRVFGEP